MTVDPIAVAALRMRNASPDAFEMFIKAIEQRTDAVTVAVTEAPVDGILVAQGRAQQMRAILRILKECHLKTS